MDITKTFSLTVEMDYDDMIHFDITTNGFTSMELIGILETQKQKIIEDARDGYLKGESQC